MKTTHISRPKNDNLVSILINIYSKNYVKLMLCYGHKLLKSKTCKKFMTALSVWIKKTVFCLSCKITILALTRFSF